MTLAAFISEISTCLATEDGEQLVYLLDPHGPRSRKLLSQVQDTRPAALARFRDTIASPWDEIAIAHVQVVVYCVENNFVDGYKAQRDLSQAFLRFFQSSQSWSLPGLYAILRTLRDLAYKADESAFREGKSGQNMEDAARICNKAFTTCLTDRVSPYEQSRKWGIYYVVGLALKCYFKINRITLSKNVIRAINANQEVPPLSAYPLSHQVTYKYYLGMLSFLNEEYKQSGDEFRFAFDNCPVTAVRNQERILTFLIPLRILHGELPSTALLARFPFLKQLYTPFVEAIRKGDLTSFDKALSERESKLANIGVLLTIEKAREICLRGLFRKVWVATDKSNRIPISMFHTALRISGMGHIPIEEAECLVANMIFKNFMKGYIAHEKQMVVLANIMPFPRVADIKPPFA